MSVDVAILISIFSVIVGVGGFVVALVTLSHNKKKDMQGETKEQVEIHAGLQSQIDTINAVQMTRLDAIDNGIRDLKAERRTDSAQMNKRFDELRDEVRDVYDEARHARELAEAAHRRLDRIDAPQDNNYSNI